MTTIVKVKYWRLSSQKYHFGSQLPGYGKLLATSVQPWDKEFHQCITGANISIVSFLNIVGLSVIIRLSRLKSEL